MAPTPIKRLMQFSAAPRSSRAVEQLRRKKDQKDSYLTLSRIIVAGEDHGPNQYCAPTAFATSISLRRHLWRVSQTDHGRHGMGPRHGVVRIICRHILLRLRVSRIRPPD